MMNLMKYKSVGESGGFLMIRNGLSALLKSPQKVSKQLLMVESRRLGFSNLLGGVSAGFSTSAASGKVGSRRFFNTFRGAVLDNCFGKSATEQQHVSFNQFPGLMAPGSTDEKNSETRLFLGFNPTSGSFERDLDCNPLPVPHGYACHGSAYGWVFLVGDELDTKLMNPFTGEEIQLPSVKTLPRASRDWIGINKWYVLKAVFSSDPSLQPAPLVMVIHRGHSPRLAYCKPGDISWTSLHHRHTKHYYEDVIFYNDQFYAISQPEYIMAYDVRRLTDDKDQSVKKTLIAPGPKGLDKHRGDLYLVVLDGELIKITRKILRCLDCKRSHTTRFMIWRFVASEHKWVKVESLGDNALFLGKNTSFSLRASEHPGCIPNAIYFTDCSIYKNQPFGYDMGVYKLSDQSIMPLSIYTESVMPPPVWVTKVPSYAEMGRRLFYKLITQPLVKRDMFQSGDIRILFSGRQSLGCFVPHQCNKSLMHPYFARSIASSSASHSSGQTPQQELKKKEDKCQIVRSSKLQRERCEETYSTEVSLNQFPGLMVPGMVKKSKTRGLLRLNPDTGFFEQEKDHSHHSELQVPHGHVCRGSAYGWLFLTDKNLDMKLFNPFSGAEIKLPPVKALPPSESNEERWLPCKWFVRKAVFSANPSVEPRPVVLVIYGGQHIPRLAFCKPGDERWTPLEFPIKRHFQWGYVWHRDAMYHKGQFYVLSHPGYVATFDIGRCIDDDDLSVKTTLVATAPKREIIYMRDWYLVMLDGKLVRFEFRKACFRDCCIEKTKEMMEKERMRDGDTTDEDYTDANSDEDYDFNYAGADEDSETEVETENEDGDNDDDVGKRESTCMPDCIDLNLPSLTYGIKIRRFDESEQQWVKVESLGDKAVFLGYNTSFALSASDYPAGHCVPDSIYFTYGEGGNARTEKVCYDMGIYSVKDKIVKPLYPPMPMNDDDDASQFKKPAPIWIVNSSDRV